MGNFIPWNWGKKNLPIRREDKSSSNELSPYLPFQNDISCVFDNFFGSFETGMLRPFSEMSEAMFQPRVEVKESSGDLRVSVELPGIDDKDLDVSISEDALIISGEKREVKEENTCGYYRMERCYGSFHRRIPFPFPIDRDRAEASFKKGVLNVVLPKTTDAKHQVKKINIKKS
ncbi:MAG: Hsp20/alpha crystallin family protein [Candidatus Obscuribacterales bacterium]|nr:Hsp20/alpha crystallin family protein [Candidatus Obscuribacterales bacterium]